MGKSPLGTTSGPLDAALHICRFTDMQFVPFCILPIFLLRTWSFGQSFKKTIGRQIRVIEIIRIRVKNGQLFSYVEVFPRL